MHTLITNNTSRMNMRFKQKWGLLFLLFVIVAYILISSFLFQSKKDKVTEIFFADRMTAAHKMLIDRYNKLHEEKVKVIPIDFPNFDFSTNERKEMLARSLRGRGDGIDLFAVDPIWVQRFAKWCEPVDKYFSDSEREKILSSALESCYYEGELVAVPLDMVQGIMYYRDDLLKKCKDYNRISKELKNSLTWEEFLKIKNEVNCKGPFYIFPAADYEGLICVYIERLLSLERNYFNIHGFNFNTPEAAKALQLLVDLVHNYHATPEIVTDFTEVSSFEYFIRNNGLFIWGWPTYDKDFKENPFNPEKESQLKKAPVPHFKSGIPTSIWGGWDLMVSKFSNKKEAVVDFVKFLLRDDSQEIFYKESGYYPVSNDFYTKEKYLIKYPEIKEIKEFMKSGIHRPAHTEYTRYSKIMSFYINSAIRKQIPVDKALNECTLAIQTDRVMIERF